MEIKLIEGLLHTSLTLTYHGKTTTIDRLIIDTGAAQTLISADSVFDIGIFAHPNDELTVMGGIGGEELAFRKVINHVVFDTLEFNQFPLDFGDLDEDFGINGIIGLDILLKGKFVIDLAEMTLIQK